MQSLMILGRQPLLGLAELESLYGADKIRPVGEQAAVVDVDPCRLAFERLGGSVKFCKLLTELQTTSWEEIEKFLIQTSPGHSKSMPEGKMILGLSLYGFNVSPKRIEATGLSIKKAVRKTGRPVRLVPNKFSELNSAQVIHNKLVGENGWELVFVQDGQKTIVAQTVKVQNLESYTLRDRGRPKRDARVGMLPPKLAQIIINLAVGKLPEDKLESICEIPAGSEIPRPNFDQTILDPFCGTGVVLQEALLMGYNVFGSDISQKMFDYAQFNLNEWLLTKVAPNLPGRLTLAVGDATSYKWGEELFDEDDEPYFVPENIFAVASETYLGRPFTNQPDAETLKQTISECNIIIKKFLQNIHDQLKPDCRLCIAAPAWKTSSSFRHLPLVDQLADLGYNRLSFERVRDEDLIYYRETQIVARQLLVLTRK